MRFHDLDEFRGPSSAAADEALAQLAFVHPARRAHSRPLPNRTLDVIVIGSVALRLVTAFVPALRSMLGLEPVPPALWAWLALAVVVSWAGAELCTRRLRSDLRATVA